MHIYIYIYTHYNTVVCDAIVMLCRALLFHATQPDLMPGHAAIDTNDNNNDSSNNATNINTNDNDNNNTPQSVLLCPCALCTTPWVSKTRQGACAF